ncbi:MAG: VCBS repeat-containing protein [Gammaproteobacteria bacterium]|nr:VCBS repeat-containing protein [Gammaproteobacteria bacterium]
MAPALVNGDEPFQLHQQFEHSGSANDIATGDIDRDGDADIAVASNGVLVYVNVAPGQYEERQRLPLNNDNVSKVALADLDLDGDLDLVAARNGSPIEIYWNDGTGAFEEERFLFSAEYSAPTDMFVIDINHDGAADIVTQNINAKPRLFLNDGHGDFPASSKVLLDSRYENKITLADIDRDGHLDIVTHDDHEFIKFHSGNGNGDFAHDPSSDIKSEDLQHLVVGDINADGREDLLLVEFEGIRLLINSASGEMLPKTLDLGIIPNEISAIAIADTNNDGFNDLVLSLRRLENLLYINTREADFERTTVPLGGKDKYVSRINVFDFDGDRDNDILFSSRPMTLFSNTKISEDNRVQDSRQKAGSSFSFAEGVTINHQERIDRFELADFNGDKLDDLVTLTVSGHNPVLEFFLNEGGGALASHGSLKGPAREEVGDILFADIDSDGDLDLLIGWLKQYITIHRNDGQGTFDPAGQALSKSTIRTRSLITGFVNNDAHVDIVATGDRRTQIYFSTGDGRYITDHMSGLPTDAGADVTLADIDRDGDFDLVISSKEIMVYYNRGNGSFEIPGTELFNPNEYARQIFAFDIDGDSDLDLLAGGGSTYSFINEGQGNFAEPAKISTLDSIALDDLERDGDIDIVSYRQGIKSAALASDGRGGWIPNSGPVIDATPRRLRLADFDGDGDPDIIATGYYGNHLLYYANLGLAQPTNATPGETATQSGEVVDDEPTGSTSELSETDDSTIFSEISRRDAFIAAGLLLFLLWALRRRFAGS